MCITKKHLIPIIIIGILVSGIPGITECSTNCASIDLDPGSPMDGSCPYANHSLVQIAAVLSTLFVLLLIGLFLFRDRQFIPPGVCQPLYRPPRFSH